MKYEWIPPFTSGRFDFLGAYVCYSKDNANFLMSTSGTSIAIDDPLLQQLRSRDVTPEFQFKLVQRYFARTANKPFIDNEKKPNVTFFLIDLTQRCNLNCAYCIRDSASCKTISEDDLIDICDYIIDYCTKNGINAIEIQPWGGEPLLEFDKILKIREIFDSTSIACDITLETNGTLITDDMARRMWEADIKVGISIDGPEDVNDLQRTYANGRGSYADIKRGIENLQKYYGNRFGGISVITKYNVERLDDLLDHAINTLHLRSLKFNIVRDNIFAREQDLTPSIDQIVRFNIELFHAIERINKDESIYFDANIDIRLCDLLYSSRKSCCYSCGCLGGYKIISFDTAGNIYPCDATDLKKIALGSIHDGVPLDELILRNERTNRYYKPHETDECDECPWRPFCRGGCSSRILHCGYKEHDVIECAITKAVFPEYVKYLMEKGDEYKHIVVTPQFQSCLDYLDKGPRKSAYLAISNACNLCCKTCPAVKGLTSEDRFLTLDDVSDFLERNRMTEGDRITVSGGEPTENPQFLDIIGLLKDRGLETTILSNSVNFSDGTFCDKFLERIDKRRTSVSTAIHSYREESHDEISTRPGSFARTVEGLTALYANGIRLNIKILVTKRNYRDLRDICRFIHDRFGRAVILFCGMDYCGNAEKYKDELYVSFEEIQPELEAACDYLMSIGHPFKLFEIPRCATSPEYWGYIEPGVSTPKLNLFPDAKDRENLVINRCNTDYKECGTCTQRLVCVGIWPASYAISKGSLPRPITRNDSRGQ